MKFVYGFILFVVFILLLVIYFTNLLYVSSTPMFLFSRNTNIPFSLGLLVIIFLSFLLGVITVLFIQSFVKWRPKDIFDEDF